MVFQAIECARKLILGVARMICRYHQQDVIVANTHRFEILVENERVKRVAVVEVEFGSGQDDEEVVFVALHGLFTVGLGWAEVC